MKKNNNQPTAAHHFPFLFVYKDVVLINRLLLGLLVVLSLAVWGAMQLSDKPPVVIRLTDKGALVSKDYTADVVVTKQDIEMFVKRFVYLIDLHDSFKIDEVWRGLNMMTPELRQYFLKNVFTPEACQNIVRKKIDTKTKIEHITYVSKGEHISVEVTYKRSLKTFDQRQLGDKLYKLEMLLKTYRRTEANSHLVPFGLLVSDYKQIEVYNGQLN